MKLDRCPRRSLLATLLLLAAAGPALAQVGHDPARSPYRTLRYGQFIGINGGYFGGEGGQIGIGPHHGETIGLRYDFLGAGTLTLGLSGTYMRLERFIVDSGKPIETARRGPVAANMALFEGIFQLNITGGKTWRGIAPFVAVGAGLGLAGRIPADSLSGFKFRLKAALTPGLGARVFLSDRLFLRLEARTTFWQVSYPLVYLRPPSSDPTKPAVVSGNGKEWVTNTWYTVGLSYAFHRPF
jgi:hypothetical protein